MIRRPPRSTLFPTRRSSDLTATSARTRNWPLLELVALGQGKSGPATAGKRDGKNQKAVGTYERDSVQDRKSTRLNSSHGYISYAVFCLKKKKYYKTCTCYAT